MRPKINILYADDDAIAVELLKRQVGTDDFCVRIASDGQKAWELFQSHVPDILLLTRVRDKDCVKNRVKRAKIVRFTLC